MITNNIMLNSNHVASDSVIFCCCFFILPNINHVILITNQATSDIVISFVVFHFTKYKSGDIDYKSRDIHRKS